jgi:hypothetical protein
LSSLQAYNNGERADDLQNRLARLKAPRALTTEQRERVIDKMRTFAGTTFDFGANGDSEPLGLVD